MQWQTTFATVVSEIPPVQQAQEWEKRGSRSQFSQPNVLLFCGNIFLSLSCCRIVPTICSIVKPCGHVIRDIGVWGLDPCPSVSFCVCFLEGCSGVTRTEEPREGQIRDLKKGRHWLIGGTTSFTTRSTKSTI